MKQGGYGGRARYILKDNLKFVPLYGWYLGLVSLGVRVCEREKEREREYIT